MRNLNVFNFQTFYSQVNQHFYPHQFIKNVYFLITLKYL